MGTLLPNFLLSDVEDEFFFSSATEDRFYLWKDDSLMEDKLEQKHSRNKIYLSHDRNGIYRITEEGKITT
tara:strand:- start:310 stop:519 length:210 start_codon:yes stop_codon:yes gene_type:complete